MAGAGLRPLPSRVVAASARLITTQPAAVASPQVGSLQRALPSALLPPPLALSGRRTAYTRVRTAAAAFDLATESDVEYGERARLEEMVSSIDEDDDGPLIQVVASSDEDESLLLENNGLSDETVRALNARGIKALFPIQKAVFAPAMEGKDLIARARTGSGKTLAFALPIIEKIITQNGGEKRRGRRPQCIILAPTRELAGQVHREIAIAAPSLDCGCFYGGSPYPQMEKELRRGVDIAVGTPGRIIDLIDRKVLDLSEVRFAVLDEADQMLNVGFEKDVEVILDTAPKSRQTLLFSATMPRWVKQLTKRHQRDPITVDLVGDQQTGKMAEGIRVLAVQVTPDSRRSVLVDVLTVYGAVGKSIVFTKTKRDADEVAAGIAQSLQCEPLHGDITQAAREKTLRRFREDKFSVLVATDVAARGLDIPNVDLVVHYELPQEPEGFLHRSGRTGRAGRSGTTVALYTRRETGYLKRVIKETETSNIEFAAPPSPKQVMHAAATQVVTRLQRVDKDVQTFFLPAARLILGGDQPELRLAAALAALSGRMEVPQPRSLITQEEGVVTMRIMTKRGQLRSVGQAIALVRKLLPQAGERDVGRVRWLEDGADEGAAIDLPPALADALAAQASELAERGLVIDRPSSLPMEEDMFDGGRGARRFDGYGRNSSSYGRGGGGRGGSGGGGGGSFSRGGRGGGGGSFSRGGRGGGSRDGGFERRDGGGWGGDRARSSGGWSGGGDRARSGGGYSDGGRRAGGGGGGGWRDSSGWGEKKAGGGSFRRGGSDW